jgi:hypothetical protein
MLATFADTIVNAFNGPHNFFETLVQEDWSTSINADFAPALETIKSRIILPAGKTFFFKQAVFSAEGHLMVTTTYRD